METISFRRSRRSFILNYILGTGLFLFLFLSGALTDLSPLWLLFFIVLIMIFFLEPEGILVYKKYHLEEDNFTEVKGIITKEKTVIPYRAIPKTILKKGVIGRLFNFGDVVIRGHREDLILKGIKNPEKIFDLIRERSEILKVES